MYTHVETTWHNGDRSSYTTWGLRFFWSERIKRYCIFHWTHRSERRFRHVAPSSGTDPFRRGRRASCRTSHTKTCFLTFSCLIVLWSTVMRSLLKSRDKAAFHKAGHVKWRWRIGRCLLHAIRGDATPHVVRKQVRVHLPAARGNRRLSWISPNSAHSKDIYPTPYPPETEAAWCRWSKDMRPDAGNRPFPCICNGTPTLIPQADERYPSLDPELSDVDHAFQWGNIKDSVLKEVIHVIAVTCYTSSRLDRVPHLREDSTGMMKSVTHESPSRTSYPRESYSGSISNANPRC